MQDGTDSIEERIALRRVRRWQRRGRIAAPFVAVPATFVVLLASVDLIEHRPAADDRPTTTAASTRGQSPAIPALRPTPPVGPGAPRAPQNDLHSISVAEPTFSASASLSEPVIGNADAHAYGNPEDRAQPLRPPNDSRFRNAR